MIDKRGLFDRGRELVGMWCYHNRVEPPEIRESDDPSSFGTCAYYRDGVIHIDVEACAGIGMAGRAWSYPGYAVDRTPYGVLCHELGHHVDGAEGTRGGAVSKDLFAGLCGGNVEQAVVYSDRIESDPAVEPVSGYHDNVLEWFAEMFRLFVTNPDLLRALRPRAMRELGMRWPSRAERRGWEEILAGSRQLAAARNRIAAAEKRRARIGELLP